MSVCVCVCVCVFKGIEKHKEGTCLFRSWTLLQRDSEGLAG